METPNKWIIVEIKYKNSEIYKIIGGWDGGYLNSYYWKISDGIESISYNCETEKYEFYGFNNEIYSCRINSYKLSFNNEDGYNYLKNIHKNAIKISIMPSNTNWMKLKNKKK